MFVGDPNDGEIMLNGKVLETKPAYQLHHGSSQLIVPLEFDKNGKITKSKTVHAVFIPEASVHHSVWTDKDGNSYHVVPKEKLVK